MSTFNHDRESIVDLPVFYAKSLLKLLENGTPQTDAPVHLRPALAAAQRCPDIARYFLAQKCALVASNVSPFARN